jgi:hypothetical protein
MSTKEITIREKLKRSIKTNRFSEQPISLASIIKSKALHNSKITDK